MGEGVYLNTSIAASIFHFFNLLDDSDSVIFSILFVGVSRCRIREILKHESIRKINDDNNDNNLSKCIKGQNSEHECYICHCAHITIIYIGMYHCSSVVFFM